MMSSRWYGRLIVWIPTPGWCITIILQVLLLNCQVESGAYHHNLVQMPLLHRRPRHLLHPHHRLRNVSAIR